MKRSYSRDARRSASSAITRRRTPMHDPANMPLLVMCQLSEMKPGSRSVIVLCTRGTRTTYMHRWCSSSTTSEAKLVSVVSCGQQRQAPTEILQPPIISMPSMSWSAAVDIASCPELVAVAMSMDIELDIPDISIVIGASSLQSDSTYNKLEQWVCSRGGSQS